MQNDTVHKMWTQCNLYDLAPKSVLQTDVTIKYEYAVMMTEWVEESVYYKNLQNCHSVKTQHYEKIITHMKLHFPHLNYCWDWECSSDKGKNKKSLDTYENWRHGKTEESGSRY